MAIGILGTWRIDATEGFFGSPLKGLADKIKHHAAATQLECGALFAHVRKTVLGSSAGSSPQSARRPVGSPPVS
jgi:hypothetical protein